MNLSGLNLLLLGGEANTKLLTSSHNLWSSFFLEAGSMNAKKLILIKILSRMRSSRQMELIVLAEPLATSSSSWDKQKLLRCVCKKNNNPDLSIAAAVLHCIH
jgi:hypothetical protein